MAAGRACTARAGRGGSSGHHRLWSHDDLLRGRVPAAQRSCAPCAAGRSWKWQGLSAQAETPEGWARWHRAGKRARRGRQDGSTVDELCYTIDVFSRESVKRHVFKRIKKRMNLELAIAIVQDLLSNDM